jgi:hypothetical protein
MNIHAMPVMISETGHANRPSNVLVVMDNKRDAGKVGEKTISSVIKYW